MLPKMSKTMQLIATNHQATGINVSSCVSSTVSGRTAELGYLLHFFEIPHLSYRVDLLLGLYSPSSSFDSLSLGTSSLITSNIRASGIREQTSYTLKCFQSQVLGNKGNSFHNRIIITSIAYRADSAYIHKTENQHRDTILH